MFALGTGGMTADDYEKRVETAVVALTAVSNAVWSDLDTEVGGVGWWDGQVDFRRRVVLSEYLQDTLNGAAEAMLGGALEAKTHRDALQAENDWLRRVWTQASSNGAVGTEEFPRSMHRDGVAKRRDRQIDASVTYAVGHMLRALDCLAAALIIVGAVRKGVSPRGLVARGEAGRAVPRRRGDAEPVRRGHDRPPGAGGAVRRGVAVG